MSSKPFPFPKHLVKKFVIGVSLEFGPVFAFLISFELFHIYKATMILMMTTIISTVVTYKVQKRLPYLALYIAFLTTVFGYITIVLHEPKFIQMRDTLYDLTCAATLIVGSFMNISVLSYAFHSVFPMTRRAWNKLTKLWIVFFLLAALCNEYVRIHYTLAEWFDFKSIVILVTSLFGLISLYSVYEKGDA